ncbi:hypothetical protein JXL19_10255, partial [bacterium]|nr:hypothetical protein [bacterium]
GSPAGYGYGLVQPGFGYTGSYTGSGFSQPGYGYLGGYTGYGFGQPGFGFGYTGGYPYGVF